MPARLVDPGQIERTALARPAGFTAAVLCVDAAHPDQGACRHHCERVAHVNAPRQGGARRHRAAGRQSENAVDGEAKQAIVCPHRPTRRHANQVSPQRGHARIIGSRGVQREYRRIRSAVGESSVFICASTARERASFTRSTLLSAMAP